MEVKHGPCATGSSISLCKLVLARFRHGHVFLGSPVTAPRSCQLGEVDWYLDQEAEVGWIGCVLRVFPWIGSTVDRLPYFLLDVHQLASTHNGLEAFESLLLGFLLDVVVLYRGFGDLRNSMFLT